MDKKLAKSGALVYVVDSTMDSGKGPVQVYPTFDNDSYLKQSARGAGESVQIESVRIDVTSASSTEAEVRVVALGEISLN